jgi:uncharacterized protein (TIGR03032 family)
MLSDPDESIEKPSFREVKFEYTAQFPEILSHLNASILVTTYQAGKLLVLGAHEGKLQISFLSYDQPMGLAVDKSRIAIGTRKQIHFLVPAHETLQPQSIYDGCFVSRSSSYTGSIHGHDLGWGKDGLWIVNTLFSSLVTLHDDFSFVPQWRPPFISQLIDQDRCHLNGLAIENGKPRFVTAMSETDTAAGWRPNKAISGVVMDVTTGRVVCRGLSMPHSPRLHDGRLWVLNSGCGSIGFVDARTGKYEAVESLPGYTRGLSFCGQFAFVGLSKIRETSVFGGVQIAERQNELRCGIGVIDLLTSKTVAVFQFLSGVTEIFAVETLLGYTNPFIAGTSVDQQEREVWIVPSEHMPRPTVQPRLPLYCNSSNNQTIDRNAKVEPTAAELVNLGNLRQEQSNQSSAVLCYQRALELDPNCIPALQNLGYLLFNMGEAEKSHDIYQQLVERMPTALNRLLASSVLPVIYDSQADIEFWRERQMQLLRELVATGEKVDATQSLVPTCFFAAYQGLCDRELMVLRGQAIRGKDYSKPLGSSSRIERLRVGVLSAYFRDHTIGRLNIARLENLSRKHIELTVISADHVEDGMAKRFVKTADQYVQLPRDLQSAIRVLSSLDLDVLIHADVGMDSLTQTLAYSRFAPVQVATWGHPDTTGSAMIDYFLSSESLETVDSDRNYTERLLKLPTLGIYYERPVLSSDAKNRSQLGLPEGRHLYACAQTLFKFHPEFDLVLSSILESDPEGELVIIEGRLSEWTHRLKRRFRRTLPESGKRVRFLPAVAHRDFLSLLACVDVVLDPIHFGGGNSSFEAIAMGTPVVTMAGSFLRSRITSAIYEQMDFPQLISKSLEEYCDIAVRIACDRHYGSAIRKEILSRAALLFDQHSVSKEFENCLLQLGRVTL